MKKKHFCFSSNLRCKKISEFIVYLVFFIQIISDLVALNYYTKKNIWQLGKTLLIVFTGNAHQSSPCMPLEISSTYVFMQAISTVEKKNCPREIIIVSCVNRQKYE